MQKRYIVTENTNCDCGNSCERVIGFLLIGSFLIIVTLCLLVFFVVVVFLLAIIYVPKIKENKQLQKEEEELNERERRLKLEQRRRDLERREKKWLLLKKMTGVIFKTYLVLMLLSQTEIVNLVTRNSLLLKLDSE